ncbi:hypothetical protein LC613_33485 [Nostoc sphaeroides CHAB 2801]|uniref:hypothetical protein n=1 Tax=Nostoc sphaeroides TaxID=446679 RepID=UPI001E2F45D0|nr:hypothetical protein [Nostoc sphaeroides]MCC5632527.1 hypothetical protein [Nostoc sphaeroides CHAB 2801]
MSEYLFSKFRSNEFEDLYQQLSKVFTIPQNHLSSIYEIMRKEFETEGCPEHTLSRDIFHSKFFDNRANLIFLKHFKYYLIY